MQTQPELAGAESTPGKGLEEREREKTSHRPFNSVNNPNLKIINSQTLLQGF